MSCCAPAPLASPAHPSDAEIRLASRSLGDGLRQIDLSVPGIHCGGCINAIEGVLGALDGVEEARVNLTARRVRLRWHDREGSVPPFFPELERIGYAGHLHEPDAAATDPVLSQLLRALAVAGFASSNIMLLSVSVWSGAEGATRDLLHLISALIALPTLAYSGGVFFGSAWAALRGGRTNMDVPISVGVILAFAMSLYDTLNSGPHAYFDAVTSLLFFLLVGRTLDHVMRQKARSAVRNLARLGARGAVVELGDGRRDYRPIAEIEPGMTLLVAAGERVPVDGEVISGSSEVDCALVTGESLPKQATVGALLQGGTLNLTGPLRLRALAAATDSFLAEMVRLMEAAETSRSRYRRIADRAATLYSPVVHAVAGLSFLAWLLLHGDAHAALTIGVAVLIITCPCALALAVPMVQVTAARRLYEAGILMKDGAGLERLATVDTVVFDKTGTLTLGRLALTNAAEIDPEAASLAAGIAGHSRHPHARAIAAAFEADARSVAVDDITEHAGLGLEARIGTTRYRLGRAEWALDGTADQGVAGTVLARGDVCLARFAFVDELRPEAREAVAALQAQGLQVQIMSGDQRAAVDRIAAALAIDEVSAGMLPGEKSAALVRLAAEGRRVLMVGDGLNDAPALAAAQVSMAPANAADIGRSAADFVFLRTGLGAVPLTLDLARRADRLTRQNIALSLLYNLLALPFAVLGLVTPLFAALAMSSSSILVTANALRLAPRRAAKRKRREQERPRLLHPLTRGTA